MEPLVWTMVASAPRWPARRIFTISSKRSMGLAVIYATPRRQRCQCCGIVGALGQGPKSEVVAGASVLALVRGRARVSRAPTVRLLTLKPAPILCVLSLAFVILPGARFLVRRRRPRHHQHFRHYRHGRH